MGRARIRLTALAGAGLLALVAPGAEAGRGISGPAATVATATGRAVAVFARPGATAPVLVLGNPTGDGVPLTFLVETRREHWLRVYVPVRPNGTTGWIRSSAVELALDPYSLEVDLSAHRIVVRHWHRVVDVEPVGVGRAAVPTPVGTYFIVELLRQPNPSGPYGPYAFGLSAFSDVYTSFGAGPGAIGLHGTNEPWLLGRDVSHGCIRMSNAAITKLAHLLPLGTPVVIRR